MKRIFPAALLLVLFIGCNEKKETKKTTDVTKMGPLSVEGIVVTSTTLSEGIEVAGSILPFELTEIRPEISGRIIQINFTEGGFVQKNALLVKIFDGDLQAQMKKLQVQLMIAEKTEERQRELLKINGISQQDYDLSLLQVNNIKADIELTQVNIGKTEIRAPYSGRMGLRSISPGAYITPATIITSISQLDKKKISFSVPEKYSSDIKPGMKISFMIEGIQNQENGIILASESVVESNTRNLKVLATINDVSQKLVPGTFAKVNLTLSQNDTAVIVPTQCIIPNARTKQVVLFRDGKPEFTTVTTGIRGAETIQITSGIATGDTVITTGLLFIRKDSKLKISKLQ
ncbi:MAG: efflux RND transporter periplasmic adaptor subunit [Chitinophagia bacterium]|jgi:membrane fusion protein (multidrug efflux system)